MKLRTRILSALLAGALALSCALPAGAQEDPLAPQAAAPANGELKVNLRLDYAQPLTALQNHDVKVRISQNGSPLGSVNLWELGESAPEGFHAALRAKNRDGGEDATGWPKFLELSLTGLARGSYQLEFTGLGYRSYTLEADLGDYSRYAVVGTGDGTFTLGDLNGDGQVDQADREKMAQALGSADPALFPVYDFNGDEKLDVADLTYVNLSIGAQGGAQMMDGALIDPPVLYDALVQAGLTPVAGSFEDLFRVGGAGASLSCPGTVMNIPIDFSTPVTMSQLSIGCPSVGGIDAATVLVEYSDGETETQVVGGAAPAGLQALSAPEEAKSIVVTLGRRVPVKKITIQVQKTETGIVSVSSIQFLKDILPEHPAAASRVVTGLTAAPGDGQVNLKWRELPNVTGYRITYWPDGDSASAKSLDVTVPYAVVAGLENLKAYCFQVTPLAGDWEGDPCAPIEATPQPAKQPSPPDMITVTPLDGALSVSWKAAEGATFYEVYYKEKSSSQGYAQAGGQLAGTSTTLSGLKNGSAYLLYLVAGNQVGKSGPSRVMEGTPKALDYSAPEGLPKEGLVDRDNVSEIRLAWPTNYAAKEYTESAPFSPNNMMDGDYRTHWTAANWHGNEHVITTFKEPVDLQAALWCPRFDGNYPKWLRAYSVQVWYEGEDLSKAGHLIVPDPERGGQDNNGNTSGGDVFTWPNIPNRAAIPTSRFAILPFGPVKNVKQISIAVEQADYNLTSCSELMFMEYDPSHCLPDEITALFADDLHTALRAGVTKAQIDALRTRLNGSERLYYLDPNTLDDELKLAEELLSGQSSGVLADQFQSRASSEDSAKYQQGGSELQPLGAAAKAGQEITIYAQGIPAGAQVKVYASQFNAEANAWLSEMGSLRNGRNILTVPKIGSQSTERGGSLYIAYGGSGAQNLRLHVRRAVDIPVLELSNWYGMTEQARRSAVQAYLTELEDYVKKAGITETNKTSNCLNVTEISTPSVLLSLPALAVKNNGPVGQAQADGLFQSVLAWEDIMHICKTTQGIDKTYGQNDMQSRQNIRCMQMFTGAFMYAAGSHVGIGYGSCAGMTSGRPLSQTQGQAANSLFGWGIAHEIGHNMDKLGQAEITNNIFSLAVQTFDGAQNVRASRLESSGKYPGIFQKTAQGLPGASNNVFVQLGMYWQLHLAYDNGLQAEPMGFFNKFFKAWKAGTYTTGFSGLSYDEKVALTAAGTAGRDLTEFFTRWGMRLSDPVAAQLAKYQPEPRAIWYLSDQSRRDRLNGGTGGASAGTFTATNVSGLTAEGGGADQNVQKIEIRVTDPTARNLQGYEILRDGRPIAFAPYSPTSGGLLYTDEIGSGNHLTFTYTVKAYDTLGNQVGVEASAGEVRVAYDRLVPMDAYTLTRNGSTITLQMKEETPVSGLKLCLNSAPASGLFKVTIAQGGKGVVAREGNFSEGNLAVDEPGSYVTYFNKPGESSTDTRVWTYDAQSVTITGIPDTVPDNAIRLISYAGDDVSFLSDAAGFAGRLAEDFTYGDNAGEVIPKGTLVLVGNYRGDPYYGEVKVQGRFTITKTTVDASGGETVTTAVEDRDLAGECFMLAEVPANLKVSDISDGLFLFVPNVQAEAELQEASHCDGKNLLPSQVRAQFYRADDPQNPQSPKRLTAQTLWTQSPGGQELPELVLN